MPEERIRVIGGGLAGVEAACFLARCGLAVELIEMRPARMTPAHKTGQLAELVCSNSLKSDDPQTAHGLLKKELGLLGSILLQAAYRNRVPAGKALAVDRETFADDITQQILSNPLIELSRREITGIDLDQPAIIATGPLTSDALANQLAALSGSNRLFFYDAISPIVDAQSIDYDKAFFGSRWVPEDQDYVNCPLNKGEYEAFVEALLAADRVVPHAYEDKDFFEGCLPVEVIASRGAESLRFGPMRPVGLTDPATGKRPYAVLQLRKENLAGDAYNLVGFQTRLTYGHQEEVFRRIPALASARFLRFGSIHRNTFLDTPRVLSNTLSLKDYPHIKVAGQLIGVEGYMESAASGIMAACALVSHMRQREFSLPPSETAMGALLRHITDENNKRFQPMNINFGIFPTPDVPKKIKRAVLLEREDHLFHAWLKIYGDLESYQYK